MVPNPWAYGPVVNTSRHEVLVVMKGAPAIVNPVREPWMTAGNLCAQVHETHTGIVALIGDRAFKAKKSLMTDFLDFSTPTAANMLVSAKSP